MSLVQLKKTPIPKVTNTAGVVNEMMVELELRVPVPWYPASETIYRKPGTLRARASCSSLWYPASEISYRKPGTFLDPIVPRPAIVRNNLKLLLPTMRCFHNTKV